MQFVHHTCNLVQLTECRWHHSKQSELITNLIQHHAAEWIPTQASLQHMLSKHFQSPLFPSDCSQALTLICQYLQIPLRHPTHTHFHLVKTEKVIFKRGAAFWHISDQVFRFECLPRSCESGEWPLPTPTVLLGQLCFTGYSDGPEL